MREERAKVLLYHCVSVCTSESCAGTLLSKRISQQSRDASLAFILISSVVMFFFCHLPRYLVVIVHTVIFHILPPVRLVTSIYEAANIHSILDCRTKGQDKTPLWFMYVTAAVQLLMVSVLWFMYVTAAVQLLVVSVLWFM